MTDRIAVVTGGTQGIGHATALALSAAGCHVGVLARTEADVQAVCREIEARGGAALPLIADVRQRSQVESALSQVVAQWGRLDVLVNNAGGGSRFRFVDSFSTEWDRLIDLNFKGVLHCTSAALPHMLRQGDGCIVQIASRAGRMPEGELSVYSAVKAAVLGFSRALAEELRGSGVRVVAISPGPVNTEQLRRQPPRPDRAYWLEPEDVANAVVFLSSPQNVRYNGAFLDLYSA